MRAMILLNFRKVILVNLLPLVMLVGTLVWLSTIQASNDREWRAEVKYLPKIVINNNNVKVQNIRNARWHESSSTINWENRNYDLTKLNSLALIIEPFNDSKLMAHTMLDFGFGDQGHTIVSVEARKEVFEEYILVTGLCANMN